MNFDTLTELNRQLAFEPLNAEDAIRLERDAADHYQDDVLDRKVCVVTDTWVFPSAAQRIKLDDMPFDAMRAVLTGQPWCTQPITEYYDCTHIDARLSGLLLSRRAFDNDENGQPFVWISTSALNHLRTVESRLKNSLDAKPPKFAIADCFVAGAYAEIDETTVIERQVVGLAQLRGVVKVVYGGPGNVLQSHLLCWDNRDATIASRVPTMVGREHFQLILAGPMTQPQELLLAKRHECNAVRVTRAHELLRRINPLYADLQVNKTFNAARCTGDKILTRLAPGDDTANLIQEARARQASVARMGDETAVDASQECTIVETETVLLETTIDRTEEDRLARAVAAVTSSTRDYVARRSTTLLKRNDPYYLERLFPHLLTFGIGGFGVKRAHSYGHHKIVVHYLSLSTNRFAEDAIFKLAMFDYISTDRVKTGVCLRVGQDPAPATTIMRVTPAQLKTAMQNRSEQRRSWKIGRHFVPATESPLATRCLKSITATTSKMWGSNDERESMARKVDAMTIKFGAPSVFWTLTPNPDCSMVCAFWTGQPLPNGRPGKLSECTTRNFPCSSEMKRIIMGNTVVQAEYYRTCCRLLVDVLFGWDLSAHKPKSQRGIFGYVEALLYALEQQSRLFIHHHGVAWITGFPRTQSDWDRILHSDELKDRFERYCASIFAAELPVYKALKDVMCPRSDCGSRLEALSIPKKYKHLLKATTQPPRVARCTSCESDWTESEIVSALIEDEWDGLADDFKLVSSAKAVSSIQQRFGGLSSESSTSQVQLSRLLLEDQIHAFTHSSSCIKGHTGTKCRYHFFRDLVSATGFNKDDEVLLQRRIGNQWLNTYIPTWRCIFHFNIDARVLWSGHGLQASRYALQYTVKRQSILDNVAVVEMAFKKRVERESLLQSSEYALGIGRLLSLAYSTSGVMEIGGPLATAILLEGEAVTFSCQFERLVLLEGINMLNNAVIEASIVSRNQELFTETSIVKYMERPRCLEGWCWYDFCSSFRREGTMTTGNAHNCSFVTSDETQLRMHVAKHNFKYFEYPRVPEIIGPRLPDASRLGGEDYAEQSELYYRIASLLHNPFRDPRTILDSSHSARSYFDSWISTANADTKRALERHQQHYIGLQMAQQYREQQRLAKDQESDDEEHCLDDDVLHPDDARLEGEGRVSNHYISIPGDLYAEDEDVPMDATSEERDSHHEEESSIKQLLMHSIVSCVLPPDETMQFTASPTAITRAQVNKFQLTSTSDLQEVSNDVPVMNDVFHTTVVRVEAFHRAIRELSHVRGASCTQQIGPFATIREVSASFKLNYRQHVAFTLIAVPLLSAIAGVTIQTAQSHIFNNEPLIVTGAGGTGKSQIIAAVRALASSWCRPTALQVVASTGIAAAGSQGCTMHSSVGLGINAVRLPKHIESATDHLLQQWAPTLCVIADELSMTGLAFFGLWEEALRHAKDNLDCSFGGLLVVLMFDHCQLRTVSGVPLYKTASDITSITTPQDRGRRLYQSITKTVFLNENMRFLEDPEWGQWLASARVGNWKPAMRSYIQSLPQTGYHELPPAQGMIQTISTDNVTRASINHAAIRIATDHLLQDRKVYVVSARLSRRITAEELAVIRQLPDNKTGNIAIFLHIYVGMPVRVKANQCVLKGVANGACGEVHHIDWNADTAFTPQTNGTWIASALPTNIYVNIANCPTSTRFPMLPPHWPPSVMPVFQVTSSVTSIRPALSIKGFPIVPAFGTTVHGVQGETRSSIAVTNLRPPYVRSVDPHALYVALSRVRTRQGLHWIGVRPSTEDFEYFRPNSDVLFEDNRLKHHSNITITKFQEYIASATQ